MSLLALLTGAAAISGAAQLSPNHPFAWLDPKSCTTTAEGPEIPREKAIKAIVAQYGLPREAQSSLVAFGGQGPSVVDMIVACASGGCAANDTSGSRLVGAVNDMVRRPESKDFRLVWAGSGPAPDTAAKSVRAFYDLSAPGPGYRIVCLAPPPTLPEPATTVNKPNPMLAFAGSLRVGATLADAQKPALKDRDPASVSLRVDKDAGSSVGTVQLAVLSPQLFGWGEDQKDPAHPPPPFNGEVAAFMSYHRVTAPTRAKEVNDLELGLGSQAYLTTGVAVWAITADGTWETDDRFNASVWRAEVGVRPPLDAVLPNVGYGRYLFLTKGSGYTWRLRWESAFKLDVLHIDDPGDNPALAAKKNLQRVGYDLTGVLRLQRRVDDPAFAFSAAYQVREDWKGDVGDARLFTAKATYFPSSESHFAFGVEYRRGEDVTSLVHAHYWLINLGYRQ